MGINTSDLLPRIATAVVAIPLLLAIIFMAPAWGFYVLVAAAAAVSAWEYCSITYDDELPSARLVTVAATVAISAVLYFAPLWFMEAFVVTVMALWLFFLFFYKDQERVTHQFGSSVVAIFYAGIMLALLAVLRQTAGSEGPFWVLLAMVVVWSSDTGAYFAGSMLGKHKLYPAVSPNKSVEGAIGGLVASVGAAFLCNWLFGTLSPYWNDLGVVELLILVVPANLLGQTGDLVESLVKRAHDVKDSGTIIYGHGGILDRIDALIFASPWFYIFYAKLKILLA